MIEYLLSAAMAIGPALGYIDQVSLVITQSTITFTHIKTYVPVLYYKETTIEQWI